jgi:hypothetical protein
MGEPQQAAWAQQLAAVAPTRAALPVLPALPA